MVKGWFAIFAVVGLMTDSCSSKSLVIASLKTV